MSYLVEKKARIGSLHPLITAAGDAKWSELIMKYDISRANLLAASGK